MFNYNHLLDACKNLDIDPTVKGSGNLSLEARPVDVFDQPVNLVELGFPDNEREQVEEIGIMVYNLTSQMKFPEFFNCITDEGKQELELHNKAKKFLPTVQEAQTFWFQKGLQACKADENDFDLHYNGKVYKVNHAAQKRMSEFATMEMPRQQNYFPDNDQRYTSPG